MSRIECDHVTYCENCDRYYCTSCGCACDRCKTCNGYNTRPEENTATFTSGFHQVICIKSQKR